LPGNERPDGDLTPKSTLDPPKSTLDPQIYPEVRIGFVVASLAAAEVKAGATGLTLA
jgi:hypothetical protein